MIDWRIFKIKVQIFKKFLSGTVDSVVKYFKAKNEIIKKNKL